MTRRRNIAFVIPDLQIGGAERQVVDLVNQLDHDRFEATLFTFEETADLLGSVDRDRVRVVRAPRQSKFDTTPIDRLAGLITTEDIELVHCTLQMSLFMAHAAVARSGRRIPLIDAIHTTRNRGWRQELADHLLFVPLMSACDRVIAVCDAQRRFWESKYPSLTAKMVTVYNGIDLDRYRDDVPAEAKAELRRRLGIREGELVVGMVAAIRPEKNHERILEAAARLVNAGHAVKFLFAGGALVASDAARLEHRTIALGLADHVRWLGSLKDPRPMMSILDAAILFSTTESFPLTLLECLAMGKPVVAAEVGGVPEIVEHGRNGLLVPTGDVDAFVDALARLASDRASLRALAARARASVEARFSVREMVRTTEEVLLGVLRRATGGHATTGGPAGRELRQRPTTRRA